MGTGILLFVQRKPKPQVEDKAPNPVFVVLLSLFAYPGAGHLLLGRKREAAAFATVFTVATLGVLYQISSMIPEIMKYAQQIGDMGEALTLPSLPNLPSAGLWTTLTGIIWLLCAAHSGIVAGRAAKAWRPKAEMTAPEGSADVARHEPTRSPEA